MANNEDFAPAIFAGDHFNRTAKAQDYVRPALSAWRPEVKLSENFSKLGLIRMGRGNARGRQAIENSKLLLPEPFVNNNCSWRDAAFSDDDVGSMSSAQVGGRKNDFRLRLLLQGAIPPAKRARLFLAELGKRHVDVPDVDIDNVVAGSGCNIPREVARRFAVADYVKKVRPDLCSAHSGPRVKYYTNTTMAHSLYSLTP